MKFRRAGLDPTTRTSTVMALAFGLTFVAAFASYAGMSPPTPTPSLPCDMGCRLDKKCSVGGGVFQDSCVAIAGDEVTYQYQVHLDGGYALVEVYDDKLGVIGQSSGGTYLTRTTTLTETTTNVASMSLLEIDPACICVVFEDTDAVTVTVVSTTPSPVASTPPPPTPSATPTPPPPTPSPTASTPPPPTPTPTPTTCSNIWPEDQITTLGKGQSPTNNPKVSHAITGHIIDPASLGQTAHRIEVCAGTRVDVIVTDVTGTPRNTAEGSLTCDAAGCSGVVNVVEKYQSVSEDGRDKDAITFIPK